MVFGTIFGARRGGSRTGFNGLGAGAAFDRSVDFCSGGGFWVGQTIPEELGCE